MLRDTEFFKSRICKIDGAGDIGDYLVNIVNAKSVVDQPGQPEETPAKMDEMPEKVQTTEAETKM